MLVVGGGVKVMRVGWRVNRRVGGSVKRRVGGSVKRRVGGLVKIFGGKVTGLGNG